MQIDTWIAAAPDVSYGFGVRIDGVEFTQYFGRGWSVTTSTEQAFSTATLPLVQNLHLAEGRHEVTLYAGWNGVYDLCFRGEITADSRGYWPVGGTITCGGYLKRTEANLEVYRGYYYSSGTPEETDDLIAQIPDDAESIPITTDADIKINIIEAYNLTPATSNHHIEASAVPVAHYSPIIWDSSTQPGYALIQELDRITNYRTADSRNGAIYTRQVQGTVPSSVRHTFRQGVDLLDRSLDRSYDVYNRVVVRGAKLDSYDEQIEGVSPVGDPEPSPYIPDPPGVRTLEGANSELIETEAVALQIADDTLGWAKQPLQQFTITVPGCPDLDLGDAIRIETDDLTTNGFIVAHTLSGDPFRSSLTIRGSTVAEARPNQPPVPGLVVTVVQQSDYIGGTLTPVVDLNIDATSSSDPDGTVAAYEIVVDGTTYTTPVVSHLYTGSSPVSVQVTVTDDQGLSATLMQDVTWDASTVIVEPLVVAELTDAEYTGDGGATYTTATDDATITAPLMLGGTICYAVGAALKRSTDKLVTRTAVHTFPATVACLWNNESITTRWIAGLANGDVWLSIDDGVTWTKLYTFAAAVNDLSESPFAPGEMQAVSGESLWHTYSGAVWTAEATVSGATALRTVAGFGRRWAGYSSGVVKSNDGATVTLPTPAAVRGLTLDPQSEQLHIFTDSTATYRWTADGGIVAGPSTGTAANRAIASGVGRWSYVATNGALQKWFPFGDCYDARIVTSPSRVLAVGHMRGTSLQTRQPVIGLLLGLIPSGSVYGVLQLAADGSAALYNTGLPTGCSVVYIAIDPINPLRVAVLVNEASYPYPQFATQSGQVITGSPSVGYPTTGHSPLYVSTDGTASFSRVDLPTACGNSDGRVLMSIHGLDWYASQLRIVGAVNYYWPTVPTPTNTLWTWTSGSAATKRFQETDSLSIPLFTLGGQGGDVVTLEGMNAFASVSGRIGYATSGGSGFTVTASGASATLYGGADLLPGSRTLIATIPGGDVVRFADYRTGAAPTIISTTAAVGTSGYGGFPNPYTLPNALTVAGHGTYYIDASNHVQRISNPGGTASVAATSIPSSAVIGAVRSERSGRAKTAALDPANRTVYQSSDGVTWQAQSIPTTYVLSGAMEVLP